MTRKTYSFLAGLIAAAGVGAWWWRVRSTPAFSPAGTIIFDNTPRASSPDAEI